MISLAVGGFVICVLLFFALKGQGPGVFREFQTKLKRYPDLLVYAAVVEDGIILNKDGSFLAGWSYRGDDFQSASAEEMDACAARVDAALGRRGSGWMMHVDAIRRPSRTYTEAAGFPDRTTRLIDDERRRAFAAEGAHFETRFVLCVTYLPSQASEKTDVSPVTGLSTFKAALREIEGELSTELRLHRLVAKRERDERGEDVTYDELLAHVTLCVAAKDERVRLPRVAMFLDAVLGNVGFVGGLEPRVGDEHTRAIGITGFPNESYAAIIEGLDRLALPYRWSNRFIFLDDRIAEKQSETRRKKWFVGRKSMKNYLTGDGGTAVSGTESRPDSAIDAMTYGYYTSVIVVADTDASVAGERARRVLEFLFDQGYNARIEDVNAVEAFLGTHPGNGYVNVRKPLVQTRSIAGFMPLTMTWAGEDDRAESSHPQTAAPLAYARSNRSTPFRLNLHVGDDGHTAIVGPAAGAGKSALIGMLAASHFRYPGAQVFAFDTDYAMLPLVRSARGEYYDLLGTYERATFCPLAHVDEPAERMWAAQWLESLAVLQGIVITANHRMAIYQGLMALAQSDVRSLSAFVQGPLEGAELRAAIGRYTAGGSLGALLDAKTDVVGDGAFQSFEVGALRKLGRSAAPDVAAVFLYLIHRIEQRFDGRPTLLVFDDAWASIDDPLFTSNFRGWLKLAREKNVAVVFSAEVGAETLAKPLGAAIVESCQTKIYLPNAEARGQAKTAAYQGFGLSDRQIELLSDAIAKRQYYYTSPNGRRLFDLGLGPIARSFVDVGGEGDLKAIRTLRSLFGDDWPAEWLYVRGQRNAAALWLAGDASLVARALEIMGSFRETWPAEWLRTLGHQAMADRWLETYERRKAALARSDLGSVAPAR